MSALLQAKIVAKFNGLNEADQDLVLRLVDALKINQDTRELESLRYEMGMLRTLNDTLVQERLALQAQLRCAEAFIAQVPQSIRYAMAGPENED